MCGRYAYKFTWPELHALLSGKRLDWSRVEAPDLFASYNLAPTQTAPVITKNPEGLLEGRLARWGLAPVWTKPGAKGRPGGPPLINARADTVASKPAFRGAFKTAAKRVLVPVSGFYEWQQAGDGGAKRPHYIYRADQAPLVFAGLCERWKGPEGEIETFTIITTEANGFMARLHDRMPVIFEPEQAADWLDAGTPQTALQAMLAPAADGVLAAHPVGTMVNSPRNNGPELTRPAAA